MKASVGDRIVVVSPLLGHGARTGRIVEVKHADGSPPYLVAWTDAKEPSLYFPGTDSHIEHQDSPSAESSAAPAPDASSMQPAHVKTWSVTIYVYEQGPDTDAHVVLHAEAEPPLQARGHAHRADGDPDVPEIGDELAVARALRRLAANLEHAADEDITGVSGLSDPVDLFDPR